MKRRKIIMDCDEGHDDAIAIINGKSPSVCADEDFLLDQGESVR